jgi:hypothetical protein
MDASGKPINLDLDFARSRILLPLGEKVVMRAGVILNRIFPAKRVVTHSDFAKE